MSRAKSIRRFIGGLCALSVLAVACDDERRVVASPDLECDGAASGTFEADLDPTVLGAASTDAALDQILEPFVAQRGGAIVEVRDAVKAVVIDDRRVVVARARPAPAGGFWADTVHYCEPYFEMTEGASPSTEALATSPPASVRAETVPVDTPAADGDPGDQAAYDEVLRDLDVAVDTAPASARDLGDAMFCGWDELGGPSMPGDKVDAAARSCFVEAHRAGRRAVFVNRTRDNEGAPVPIIVRTSDSQAVLYWDLTKSLSSETWRIDPCSTLYVSELDTASAVVFSCTKLEGAEPA